MQRIEIGKAGMLGIVFAGLLLAATAAHAVRVDVFQESAAGAGDFAANPLGFVDSFSTGLTTAQFYQYGLPNAASYNGELNGGPTPVSSLSEFFFVEASDGLSLVVVHDNPNDGSGGSTRTRWNLTGDTAAQVLADDPGEPIVVSSGGTQFDSTKNWIACCTDGYAIGTLDGSWALFGQFLATPAGIISWAGVSADFSSTALVLDPGRRVLLTPQSDPIPEPGSLILLGSGLVGLAGYGRKRGKR